VKNRWIPIGACALAVGVLVLGLVFKDQADFSRDYVQSQLAERAITFTPVENLLPEQQDIPCLVANAGKPLITGKQAECYATYQIGIDLNVLDNGNTYFEDHYNGYLARMQAQAALAEDPDAPETQALVDEANRVQRLADDLLAGEATRGLLLSGYGFSVIGDRLAQAAVACFIIAVLLFLAGVLLFILPNRQLIMSRRKQPVPS
jgi:hypothetical protein